MKPLILLAVLLALTSACSRHPQSTELSKIRVAGGTVRLDDGRTGQPVIADGLMTADATDAHLQSVAVFSKLREIYLANSSVTDAGMTSHAQLGELQKLDLFNTKITNRRLSQAMKNWLAFTVNAIAAI